MAARIALAIESATPIDIAEARRILDEDHYGL
jgi:ATP-dependent Lon protease